MTELDANCDLWVTEIAGSERPAEDAPGTAVDDDTEEYGFLDLPERALLGVARLQVELFVVIDPRKRRGVRHPLISVLTIAILGCICGCDNANRTRTANAAENLNVVRALALNGLRAFTGDTLHLPRRRRLCDDNPDGREAVLASSPTG